MTKPFCLINPPNYPSYKGHNRLWHERITAINIPEERALWASSETVFHSIDPQNGVPRHQLEGQAQFRL
jgi:hypothetical protein